MLILSGKNEEYGKERIKTKKKQRKKDY